VAVDPSGKEHDARPSDEQPIAAALLTFPDGEYHLGFQFNPPQRVKFNGAGMEFTVGVVDRDTWHIGFCKADEFDSWRGK